MREAMVWKFVKLKEIAELIIGRTPSKQIPEYYTKEEGLPWVKIENLGHREVYETETYLTELGAAQGKTIPKGALLLSTNGTVGKVGIAGRQLQTNQQITAIICRETDKILPEYLYYYFKFAEKNIQSLAYATVANRVSKGTLEQFIVPIAPLSKQEEWTKLLKRTEDYLWKKKELLRTLETYEERQLETFYFSLHSAEKITVEELKMLTRNMIDTIQTLLASLLYQIFEETDSRKYLYYEKESQKLPLSGVFERLVPEAGRLLSDMSAFQQALYRKFYEVEEPAAVHEMLKQLKQENRQFADRDIQSALASVEVLRQMGLLNKQEDRKLFYNAKEGPTEENTVRDREGNYLEIGMWNCIFPEKE